jgi:hypothetical protein
MPFTFKVIGVTRESDELVLSGRILSGAFFGPEAIIMRSSDGTEFASYVLQHGMESPEGWPVVPQHRQTTLTLRTPLPPHGFNVVELEGVGVVAQASGRIDMSNMLLEPEFWATQLELHCQSDDTENPGLEWLGVTQQAASEWYLERIQAPINRGVWPYLRVEVEASKYIEFEMAGGAEYQDRILIGDTSTGERALLGYHSGHFSLPALRIEELAHIAQLTEWAPANLLWLSATYMQDDRDIRSLVVRLVSGVPGLSSRHHQVMADAFLESLKVSGLKWVVDPTLGWINNWAYSQRNPQSLLCHLKSAEFAFVQRFFASA